MSSKTKWSTAVHEVGHALVASYLGAKVRRIKVGINGDDWSGKTYIDPSSNNHLSLIDQLAICIAGLEAQELLKCDMPPPEAVGAAGDYGKVQTLFDDHDIAEAKRSELCAVTRRKVREILVSQLDRLKELAQKAADDGEVTF